MRTRPHIVLYVREVGFLLSSLKQTIKDELSRHLVLYLLIFFVFIAGIIAGMYSLNSITSIQKQNALSYVNGAFGAIKQTSPKWSDVYISSLYNNAIIFLPLAIMGLFSITIPIVFVIICIKGYLLGFSIAFVLSSYKFLGLFIILLCIILPAIITFPCYFLLAKKAVLNSLDKYKRRDIPQTNRDVMLSMGTYVSDVITLGILLGMGLLIESIITPIIITFLLRFY